MPVLPAFRRPVHLLRSTVLLVRTGQFRELGKKLLNRLSDEHSLVGLRIDLQGLGPTAGGGVITVRPAQHSDVTRVIDLKEPDLPRREQHDRIRRHRMLESGIQTCYVGAGPDGVPCFVQWLILPDQNSRLREVFGGWYPPLLDGEAMVECVYTHPSRRGQGVMSDATPQLLRIARDQGMHTVVTFVPTTNARSLYIHLRMGFVPYLLHLERRRLGVLRRTFLPVSSLREIAHHVPGFNATQLMVTESGNQTA
jgi:RimJ/RimL family protein N-acetyltransferase